MSCANSVLLRKPVSSNAIGILVSCPSAFNISISYPPVIQQPLSLVHSFTVFWYCVFTLLTPLSVVVDGLLTSTMAHFIDYHDVCGLNSVWDDDPLYFTCPLILTQAR
jgi:hypothetical protein